MNKFAERLKELRNERYLSQMDLALETGLSQSAITTWETGSRQPNSTAIVTLANYFEVSCDYLLGVSDER